MHRKKHFSKKIEYLFSILLTVGIVVSSVTACGGSSDSSHTSGGKSAAGQAQVEEEEPAKERVKGSRDNTPVCLVPEAPGEVIYENEYARMDASNISEGYIVMRYTGQSPKVKLQITGPDQTTYTYNLSTTEQKDEVFSLQSGNGDYMVNVYENIEGTQYSEAYSQLISVTMENEFSPFLYPNQNVNFTSSNNAIKKGEELAFVCNNDLEVVSEVYNYIIKTVSYDHEEAETVKSGYIPDIDEVLETRKGICIDYSALMVSMLRSQRIPTRMEIGYAGTAYHAWLSTYIEDVGWVNGMIEFDGTEWSLMDPTFASNNSDDTLKTFIGDGSNYKVKYIY